MAVRYTFEFSEVETKMIADCLQELPFKLVAGLVLRLEKEFQIQRQRQVERPDPDTDGLGPQAQAPDPHPDFKLVDNEGDELVVPAPPPQEEKAA